MIAQHSLTHVVHGLRETTIHCKGPTVNPAFLGPTVNPAFLCMPPKVSFLANPPDAQTSEEVAVRTVALGPEVR